MNWTRYKTLIVTGGITVVISGVLIFWILSSRAGGRELKEDIQRLKSTQSRLEASDPYPSESNYKRLRAEQAKVRERRDALKQAIREGQISPQPMGSPSRFVDYLRNELVPRLLQAAEAATRGGESGVVLRDPSFGLQKYFEGELPAAPEVPGLMVRLETISDLANVLFDSGISELVSLRATESKKETGRRGGRDGSVGLGALMPSVGAGRAGAEDVENEADRLRKEKERLFEAIEYRLEFRVYEDFFWATLNSLLADPNQIVIKRVTVTNSNNKLWPDYLKPALSGETKPSVPRRPAPRREMDPDALLKRALEQPDGGAPGQEVIGEDAAREEVAKTVLPGLEKRRELTTGGSLLNVVMDVVVYRLKAETPETTEGS